MSDFALKGRNRGKIAPMLHWMRNREIFGRLPPSDKRHDTPSG
jgi:hypothetical protein